MGVAQRCRFWNSLAIRRERKGRERIQKKKRKGKRKRKKRSLTSHAYSDFIVKGRLTLQEKKGKWGGGGEGDYTKGKEEGKSEKDREEH